MTSFGNLVLNCSKHVSHCWYHSFNAIGCSYLLFPTKDINCDIPNPQKKILEELNLRKQLLKIGTAQTLNPSALNAPIGVPLINSNPIAQDNQMSTTARAALQHANSTSFGYFVPQESSFGNNIIAVLPRFNENK